MTDPAPPTTRLHPDAEKRPGKSLALPSQFPVEIEALLGDPEVVNGLLNAYDENEKLVRANEKQRLAEALFVEAEKFSKGAFVDGIKHAAARLLDPAFAPSPTLDHDEDNYDCTA